MMPKGEYQQQLPFRKPKGIRLSEKRREYTLDYRYTTEINTYASGSCFLIIGEATIILTREQTNELLRDAKGLWSKTQ